MNERLTVSFGGSVREKILSWKEHYDNYSPRDRHLVSIIEQDRNSGVQGKGS